MQSRECPTKTGAIATLSVQSSSKRADKMHKRIYKKRKTSPNIFSIIISMQTFIYFSSQKKKFQVATNPGGRGVSLSESCKKIASIWRKKSSKRGRLCSKGEWNSYWNHVFCICMLHIFTHTVRFIMYLWSFNMYQYQQT